MCMSLLCATETITTFLIGYNPVQNKKLKKCKKTKNDTPLFMFKPHSDLFKLAFQAPELAPGCVNRNSVVPCTRSMVTKGACGLLLGIPRAVDPHPGAVGRPARRHLGQVEGNRLVPPAVKEMLPLTNSRLSRRLQTTHTLYVILYLLNWNCSSIQRTGGSSDPSFRSQNRFHQVALESSTPSVSLTLPPPPPPNLLESMHEE